MIDFDHLVLWLADPRTSSIWYDISRHKHNGRVYGCIVHPGGGFDFPGNNEYIDLRPFGPGATPDAFTVEFVMKSHMPEGVPQYTHILRAHNGTVQNRYIVHFNSGRRISLELYNGSVYSGVSYTLPEARNKIHVIHCTFEADVIEEIWVDGVRCAAHTPSFSGGIGFSDRYFLIGYQGWFGSNDYFYDGIIYELAIYNKRESEEYIKMRADYLRGKYGFD